MPDIWFNSTFLKFIVYLLFIYLLFIYYLRYPGISPYCQEKLGFVGRVARWSENFIFGQYISKQKQQLYHFQVSSTSSAKARLIKYHSFQNVKDTIILQISSFLFLITSGTLPVGLTERGIENVLTTLNLLRTRIAQVRFYKSIIKCFFFF